jgi:uncharacterized membrane protein required for colicin V production
MYITLFLLLMMLACVSLLFRDGLWSNAVRLIYVIIAALLAMNYYEPLAAVLEGWDETFTFMWDFLSLWILFFAFALILKLLTDKLSQVRVKFLKIVDQIGGIVLAIWVGWIMICFTLTTLHAAPLSTDFAGFAVDRDEKMLLVAPDRMWLGFTQKQSKGVMGRSPAKPFDPEAQYILNYHYRRAKLEEKNKKFDSIRINKGDQWWN